VFICVFASKVLKIFIILHRNRLVSEVADFGLEEQGSRERERERQTDRGVLRNSAVNYLDYRASVKYSTWSVRESKVGLYSNLDREISGTVLSACTGRPCDMKPLFSTPAPACANGSVFEQQR